MLRIKVKIVLKTVSALAITLLLGVPFIGSSTASAETPITFTEEVYSDDLSVPTAHAKPSSPISPFIESDGTFTFTTYGQGVGATLVSSTFKFSQTTSRLTVKATSTGYPTATSYTIYVEKQGLFGIWNDVATITYYVDGTNWHYDLSDLSTSANYRLRFYSPDGEITGSGTITNYTT